MSFGHPHSLKSPLRIPKLNALVSDFFKCYFQTYAVIEFSPKYSPHGIMSGYYVSFQQMKHVCGCNLNNIVVSIEK